jgi:DNA invertase Pin-like site-specific DNA recombinase
MVYGYNRVSSKQQHLDRGDKTIRDFCREHGLELKKIFSDKQSGKDFERKRYQVLKEDIAEPGDIIIVPEYDRLGRADETKKELQYFKDKGVKVVFVDVPLSYEYNLGTEDADDEMAALMKEFAYEMLIQLYDLLARQELKRKKKRQTEGIERMKARGEWESYGRPCKMSLDEFAKHYKRVEDGELSNNALARELDIPYQRYYRYKKQFLAKKGEDVC